MPAKRWNLLKAAGIGATFGVIYSVALIIFSPQGDTSFAVGRVIGGAAGGAVLFGLVAGLRNLVVRAK